MGGCIVQRQEKRPTLIPPPEQLAYYRKLRFHVTMKHTPNFAVRCQAFEVSLDPPEQLFAKVLSVDDKCCYVSSCVLPGADPWKKRLSPCQDACFFEHSPTSLLVGVYDGHGKNGRRHRLGSYPQDFLVQDRRCSTILGQFSSTES